MEVILAGMNLDVETIDEFRSLLREAGAALGGETGVDPARTAEHLATFLDRHHLTPETISAAYARISRDPRPVNELRQAAREEVEKARRSNERIIFGLGHASVAEHAVFNLDILGLSRLAIEFVEHFRLCSYTEKSQRYITLEGDFVMPAEFAGTPAEGPFRDMVERQNASYFRFYERLRRYFPERYPEMADSRSGARTLDGWAKEDARYCLCLATEAQLGMTANARNLERIIQKAAAHPLAEVRELGDRLRRALSGIAPSLIKYTEPEGFHRVGLASMTESIRRELEAIPDREAPGAAGEDSSCRLVWADPAGEAAVLAALAHEAGTRPYAECRAMVEAMDESRRRSWLIPLVRHLSPWLSLPRAFEHAEVVFDCIMSASCYAQFKRHRMGTQTVQAYEPGLGITIPPSVRDTGLAGELLALAEASAATARHLADVSPIAAPYVLTNAHRRRVLFRANLREMSHFSRLRMDAHAQWDIRHLAAEMADRIRDAYPLLGRLLVGKDGFEEMRDRFLDGSALN